MGTPQLNIKDAETTALVRELVDLTGETQTEAVRKAVKERLARGRQGGAGGKNDIYRKLKELAKRGEADKLPGATSDHSFLYDEGGAPR